MKINPPPLEPQTLILPTALGLFAAFALWAITCGALANPLAAMVLGALGGAVGGYTTQSLEFWRRTGTGPDTNL